MTQADRIFHTTLRWLLVLLIGTCTGLLAFFVNISVEAIGGAKFGLVFAHIKGQNFLGGFLVLAATNLGLVLVSTCLCNGIAMEAVGSGIPEVKGYLNGVSTPAVLSAKTLIVKVIAIPSRQVEGYLNGDSTPAVLSTKTLIVKVIDSPPAYSISTASITNILAVAGGLAVGKEGPPVHCGACIARQRPVNLSLLPSSSLVYQALGCITAVAGGLAVGKEGPPVHCGACIARQRPVNLSLLPSSSLVYQALGCITAVAGGLAVGKEGPPVHFGACIARQRPVNLSLLPSSSLVDQALGCITAVAGGLAVGKEGPPVHCGACIARQRPVNLSLLPSSSLVYQALGCITAMAGGLAVGKEGPLALGSIAAVAGGLAVGKEGPLVHCGACIASILGRLSHWISARRDLSRPRKPRIQTASSFASLGLFNHGSIKALRTPVWVHSDRGLRDLVTCGAASGIAAAFLAPVGGVLFALEQVTSCDRGLRDLVTCGAASGIAAAFLAPVGGVLFALEQVTSCLTPPVSFPHLPPSPPIPPPLPPSPQLSPRLPNSPLVCPPSTHRWRNSLIWRIFFTNSVVAMVLRACISLCEGDRCGGSFGSRGFILFDRSKSRTDFGLLEVVPVALLGVVGGLLGGLFNHLNVKLCAYRKHRLHRHGAWARVLEVLLISLLTSSLRFYGPFLASCLPCPQDPDGGGDLPQGSFNCPSVVGTGDHKAFACPDGQYNDLASLVFTTNDDAIGNLFRTGSFGIFT
ncbi:unnamed protein product [Closterium sp. Yama58-4]|nr:unnamed protein product [Closterium sp. Yama58-4]